MLVRAFAVIAIITASAAGAMAQVRDPGSYARVMNSRGGGFILGANYLSPRGCDRVADFRLGAPARAIVSRGATPYTIVVDTRDRACGRKGPHVVSDIRMITPTVPGDVELFFMSEKGAVLKRELVALPI